MTGKKSGTYEHCIIELTRDGAVPVYTWIDSGEQLRGTIIGLSRAQQRPNGRVIITLDGSRRHELKIPAEPDLKLHLLKLWFGDEALVETPDAPWSERIQNRLNQRKERRKNGTVTREVP